MRADDLEANPSDERGSDAGRGSHRDELAPTVAIGAAEVDGFIIDRYRLIQKIGEGGMGEVWLAEQKEPVRRRVALKLVKSGMNSREVIARFESERQALALMNHPSIAKVLDAGSTVQGTPYFVMEYVAGSPVTSYCDEHKLNTRERLELFIQVCDGVQHAHHKAIIHRDLKPSNILITEVDGRPGPKIIDFGVAKALTQTLSADAMLTRVGTLIGTPEYMSPEQANSSGEDIDTRTDVYSLGVVLYELVAGAPPLDFKKAALHDFLKKLREEEPSRPSVSIRTRAESVRTELTNTHRTALPALEREIRGDLDAIALKALEKDRSRRYSTPSDFAADIRRYLNHEAVLAVRPSSLYRARKFARRYRVPIATAVAFLIVLIAATAVSIRQSIRANREAATARAISDFLQDDLLVKVNPAFQGGQPDPDLKVRTLLDRAAVQVSDKFKNRPEVEASIRRTIARAYNGLGDYRRGQSNLERAVELFRGTLGPNDPETLEAEGLLAYSLYSQGEYQKVEALLVPLFERSRRVLGRENKATLAAMDYLVRVKGALNKTEEALPLSRELVDLQKRVQGPESFNTLLAMANLGHLLFDQRQYAEAEALLQQQVEIARRVEGPSSVIALLGMNLLGQVYSAEHKYQEAETMLNEVVGASVRTLGPEHSTTIQYMTALAKMYTDEKRYPEAEALYLKTLALKRKLFPPNSFRTRNSLASLITLYKSQAKFSQAEPYAVELLASRRHTLGQNDPSAMDAADDLAEIYVGERKFSAAEPLAREATEWDNKNRADVWQNYRSKTLLGASLAGQGKFAEAEPLLLEGYQGMTARKQKMGSDDLEEIDLAARWTAAMYESWGKPDEASKWRQRLRSTN